MRRSVPVRSADARWGDNSKPGATDDEKRRVRLVCEVLGPRIRAAMSERLALASAARKRTGTRSALPRWRDARPTRTVGPRGDPGRPHPRGDRSGRNRGAREREDLHPHPEALRNARSRKPERAAPAVPSLVSSPTGPARSPRGGVPRDRCTESGGPSGSWRRIEGIKRQDPDGGLLDRGPVGRARREGYGSLDS